MRLAPLTLVLFSACARGPDQASCRLVGRWEMDTSVPKALAEEMRASGKDPEATWAEARAVLAADGHEDWESFTADGRWICTGRIFDHGARTESRWKLLVDDGERAAVEIEDALGPGRSWGRTFVLETPDRMREEGGIFDGSRYVRLRPPK